MNAKPVTDFPDMLLPVQFFSDRLLVGRTSGELALRWAVLAEGLSRYWRLAADHSQHSSEEFREEEWWVFGDDPDWPFSLNSLCEVFGIEPNSVRAALRSWKERHVPKAEHQCP